LECFHFSFPSITRENGLLSTATTVTHCQPAQLVPDDAFRKLSWPAIDHRWNESERQDNCEGESKEDCECQRPEECRGKHERNHANQFPAAIRMSIHRTCARLCSLSGSTVITTSVVARSETLVQSAVNGGSLVLLSSPKGIHETYRGQTDPARSRNIPAAFAGFQLPITLTIQADPLIGEILSRKNHL